MTMELRQLGNKAFLDETLAYLKRDVTRDDCFRLSPTNKLKENKIGSPIAASNLKIGEEGHFKEVDADAAHVQWVLDCLEDLFSHHRDNLDRQLFPVVGICSGAILARVSALKDALVTVVHVYCLRPSNSRPHH